MASAKAANRIGAPDAGDVEPVVLVVEVFVRDVRAVGEQEQREQRHGKDGPVDGARLPIGQHRAEQEWEQVRQVLGQLLDIDPGPDPGPGARRAKRAHRSSLG
jgi:hypothetical protein